MPGASPEDAVAMATGGNTLPHKSGTQFHCPSAEFFTPVSRDRVLITVASYLSQAFIVFVMSSPGKPGECFLRGQTPETQLQVKQFASLAIPSHAHTL